MVKSSIFRFFALMFIVVLMVGCQSKSGSPEKKESDEKALAKIGDDVITLKRFQEFYENLPPELLFKYQGEFGKKALLDQMVELKMFARLAQQAGLDKDPQNQRRIQEAREKILATAFHIKEVTEKVTVTDDEVRNYYELHKKEHIRPERVRVREIIVSEKREAEDLIKLIREGGSFESLARERSTDRSHGASGGDLGWQQRGQGVMANPVEDAAFSLKKGEIGGPIKTQQGYHIIKLEDRLETYQRTLEETYQPIKNKIRSIKQRELLAQVKAQAKQEVKVQVNWDLLKEVTVRQAPQLDAFPGPMEAPGLQSSPPLIKSAPEPGMTKAGPEPPSTKAKP